MGYYIEVPHPKGKAQQLADLHGATTLAAGPPTAFTEVPEGMALICVVIDLHLAFWFRVAQLALEVPLEWCNAFARRGVRESEDSYASRDDASANRCVGRDSGEGRQAPADAG